MARAVSIVFGWDAPSMAQQFPFISPEDQKHFDIDIQALSRLRLRGYLTDSAHAGVVKKMTQRIGKAVVKAMNENVTIEHK